MSTSPNSVRLHRVIRAPASRVYRAFIEPDAMVKWLPPFGFVGKIHEIDAREGGGYKMSFTNFGTGQSHSFQVRFLELKENKKIVSTDTFDNPNLPGQMRVETTFKEVICGTELTIVQEGIPPQIPVEFCYLGWQESLDLLIKIVEPEIPDEPA